MKILHWILFCLHWRINFHCSVLFGYTSTWILYIVLIDYTFYSSSCSLVWPKSTAYHHRFCFSSFVHLFLGSALDRSLNFRDHCMLNHPFVTFISFSVIISGFCLILYRNSCHKSPCSNSTLFILNSTAYYLWWILLPPFSQYYNIHFLLHLTCYISLPLCGLQVPFWILLFPIPSP